MRVFVIKLFINYNCFWERKKLHSVDIYIRGKRGTGTNEMFLEYEGGLHLRCTINPTSWICQNMGGGRERGGGSGALCIHDSLTWARIVTRVHFALPRPPDCVCIMHRVDGACYGRMRSRGRGGGLRFVIYLAPLLSHATAITHQPLISIFHLSPVLRFSSFSSNNYRYTSARSPKRDKAWILVFRHRPAMRRITLPRLGALPKTIEKCWLCPPTKRISITRLEL